MRGVPECLHRRYQALDNLISELTSAMPNQSSEQSCTGQSCKDPGIKLMCDFWHILKEDPSCDLRQAVQERMCQDTKQTGIFGRQQFQCYMAENDNKMDNSNTENQTSKPKLSTKCCSGSASAAAAGGAGLGSSKASNEALPLSKVLCNLKEAASYDNKCNVRVTELLESGKVLQKQIEVLEDREKQGVKMLKQADCMWSCMEDAYKKKVADCLQRQKDLLKQLKEVEQSTAKWRKNKKDLESQLDCISKCQQELTEKINQKTNDIKCMDKEIASFKKRIESSKKESEYAKNSLSKKKKESDQKISAIMSQITQLEQTVKEEKQKKADKEQEGNKYIKEAREDLQKMCKVLLQKKLENEDLQSEKVALLQEIDVLKLSCENCRDKCKNKQKNIDEDIKKIETQIAEYRVKCIRCHQCTDTEDIRKYCTDCPRCLQERNCIYSGDHCEPDHSLDCVCQTVKQKFLDNVFDNMFTVLERQAKTGPGKAVAEAVMACLKRSRNGKLNEETRKILQEFILSTVKRNLNLTIVGGAVKTRCEMDAETYKQLMTCLKEVKTTPVPKVDKGTEAKKESCRRWGGPSECNCPKGPKACICSKKAPLPPHEPTPCPPPPPDKEDAGEAIACPHKKNTTCGPDCAQHGLPDRVGKDVASWRRDPCQGSSCPFTKNMRAAQCILGPESLPTKQKLKTAIPRMPDTRVLEDQIVCKCGTTPTKPCRCSETKLLETGTYNTKEINYESGKKITGCVSPKIDCQDKVTQSTKLKTIPSVQAEVFSKSEQENLREPYVDFQSGSIDTNHIYNNTITEDNITEIINTPSGELAIELDEELIEKIEKRIKDDSNTWVIIKKTNSGNYVIDLDDTRSKSKIRNAGDQRARIKTTGSGTFALELDKSLVDILYPGVNKSQPKCAIDSQSSVSIEFIKKHKKEYKENLKETKMINKSQTEHGLISKANKLKKEQKECVGVVTKKCDCSEEDRKDKIEKRQSNFFNVSAGTDFMFINKAEKICERHPTKTVADSNNMIRITDQIKPVKSKDYRINLHEIHNKRGGYLKIKIQCKNGAVINTFGKVTKTLSGNIALDISNMKSAGYMSMVCKEIPVIIKKSSGTYVLNLDCQKSINSPNSTLRRTASGGFLVVLKEPVLGVVRPDICSMIPKERIFKIKVKGSKDNLVETPAFLKATDSDNYILVLDKEFEKEHREILINCFGTECYVQIQESGDDTIIIYFEDNDDSYQNKRNASLTKTASGSIKILVSGPVFDDLSESKTSESNKSLKARAIEDLLRNPPLRNLTRYKNSYVYQKNICVKSSSDTNLHKKAILRLESEYLFDGASATVKKTDSGQFTVVLNKESKKKFINNLKSYLSGQSRPLIPIWKGSESGEIIIDLTSSDLDKAQYGSLKITSSGNIYMTVNKNITNQISRDVKHGETTVDTILKHMIRRASYSKSSSVAKTVKNSSWHKEEAEKQLRVLAGSSATLKKTDSGQFLILLNKQSKKAFIDDLKNYLASGCKGLIPIWRGTESGDITIILSSNDEKSAKRGSLKLTASGNIYLLVDENELVRITKDLKNAKPGTSVADSILKPFINKCSPQFSSIRGHSTRSESFLRKANNLEHKALSTNCNGRSDDMCDPSKCLCNELNYELEDRRSGSKCDCNTCQRIKCCDKTECNDDQCVGTCCWFINKDFPQFGIKPCGCRPLTEDMSKSKDKYFYYLEAMSPPLKNNNEELSHREFKIIEKRNKQNDLQDEYLDDKSLEKPSWDSFSYLPPQLPAFLKNYKFS